MLFAGSQAVWNLSFSISDKNVKVSKRLYLILLVKLIKICISTFRISIENVFIFIYLGLMSIGC